MALTDAQWADAVATAVARFHTSVTTEAQMSDEIAAATADWPTRTLSNADLAIKISRSLANLTGLIETSGPPDPNAGTLGAMAFDNIALSFYGPKTESGWGPERTIAAGPAGPSVELQVAGGFVQWRVQGEPTWNNLIAVADLKGADGEEVSLQATATHIQWRLGAGAWQNLVALSTLKGADGRNIELQKSATHIQWRYVGDPSWTDLVPLSDLYGPAAWTPIVATVVDGERRVQQVVDWTGGGGTKPTTGKYIGPAGFVDTAAEATDIRGAGGSGSGNVNGPATSTNGAVAVWDGTTGTILTNGPAIGVANAGDLLRRSDGDTRYRAAGAIPQSDVTGLTSALAGIPATATDAQYRAGSGTGYVSPSVGASAVAFITITRASAAGGLDFATFVNASITLDANLTVSGWINNYPGATGIIRFKQDATGGRTVAWASGYIVPAGFSLQATANGVTDVPYICEADNKVRLYNPSKWVA